MRYWKLRDSTLVCAFSIALESVLFSIGVSSSRLKRLHQVRDALAAKQAQQIVFQREVEARLARVALTAGTAAQLVVDTAGIVALGADDEEAARLADLVRLDR